MAKPAREMPQMHRPSLAPSKAQFVGAKQLARHLDLTHPRIAQLADEEHVLERLPNGRFNLDDSRVRYIRWLRDPERRSAKSKVDQEFTQAKAELIRIRIAEKQKVLMLTDEAMEVGEKLIGTMLTAMGAWLHVLLDVPGDIVLFGWDNLEHPLGHANGSPAVSVTPLTY